MKPAPVNEKNALNKVQRKQKLLTFILEYLAKTSAERTQPIRFPRCGTLFTYGRADVISTFFSLPEIKKPSQIFYSSDNFLNKAEVFWREFRKWGDSRGENSKKRLTLHGHQILRLPLRQILSLLASPVRAKRGVRVASHEGSRVTLRKMIVITELLRRMGLKVWDRLKNESNKWKE